MSVISDFWHRMGYQILSRRYRALWKSEELVRYRGGILPQKVLVCFPPLNGPIQEAVRAIQWLPSFFSDAEFRIVHYDEVSGSIPIGFRSWGVLGKQHFNTFGLPKRTFLDEIRSWQADLVIDLSDPANEVTDLICANAGCKWHAALGNSESQRFQSSANILIVPRGGASRQERYGTLLRYLAPK
ncbi:MAG: hypothetical protein OEM52_01125 [bacterium]|nr:hypothetical protein [bacterium]